ncbi:MAG TPA: hypothetical protein ENK43_15495 [Planctomycetes bacterium]|nr:hypothetical protein [Planctomycetota bacterium]
MPGRTFVFLLALAVGGDLGAQHVTHRMAGTVSCARLGTALASPGDLDGDGWPDFALGGRDRVEVRSGADGSLLYALTGMAGADFGFSVTGLGDVDLDGFPDFAVGAPHLATSGVGEVVVVSGGTGGVVHALVGSQPGDRFGFALASAGDLNGDGIQDLLVGSPGAGTPGTAAGRVDVIDGASGAVVATLPGLAPQANLGESLVSVGDLTGDGVPDWAAGAPGGNASQGGFFLDGTGEVVLVSGATTAILNILTGDAPQDGYGTALAALGDVDGDGVPDLAVGAPGHDGGASNGGAVRFLSLGGSGSVLTTSLGSSPNGGFGAAVILVGDQDGNGLPEVAVGAPQAPGGGTSRGEVGLVDVLAGQVTQVIPGSSDFSRFGTALVSGFDLDGDGRWEWGAGAPQAPNLLASLGAVTMFSAAPLLGPTGAGTLSQDILSINGSMGGTARRVDAVVGQALMLHLQQPMGNLQPAAFVVFGVLAAPAFTDAVALPYGIGRAAFLPCDLAPWAAPFLFVLANNLYVGPCSPFAASTAAPWTLTMSGGIPHPALMTLQAVVSTGVGSFGLSNAVILRIE